MFISTSAIIRLLFVFGYLVGILTSQPHRFHLSGKQICAAFGVSLPLILPVQHEGFLNLQVNAKAESIPVAGSGLNTVYKSGKTPEKLKNSNKNDKSGTKKDITFLRCMSNCKTDCQKPNSGLANLDCNQDCQDQCCESYEQCSFKIKTRSSEL